MVSPKIERYKIEGYTRRITNKCLTTAFFIRSIGTIGFTITDLVLWNTVQTNAAMEMLLLAVWAVQLV